MRSRHHYRYFITFIDAATRLWVVLPLKALAENQLNRRIKVFRDDKGGEYMSREWETFCVEQGIQRQHTVRAEPHQNGIAE